MSYLPGDVSNYPLSENVRSEEALTSTAKLLRRFHEATKSFLPLVSDDDVWMLQPKPSPEVVCHGDFAPYNVVLDGRVATGIIDFDTAHPASRAWELGYALYRWAPFTNPKNHDGFGTLEQQTSRAKLFCRAYGGPYDYVEGIADVVSARLQVLVDYMMARAKQDDPTFEANLTDGHHLLYLADIEYVKSNRERINAELASLKNE